MARPIAAVLAALVAIAVVGVGILYAGIYNVGATAPHTRLVYAVMQLGRRRSIVFHARGIAPPADLARQDRIVAGVAHYADHCATCHGGPGVEAEDMAEGMYPSPPDLTNVAARYSPGELFWILKHGIKMSGMPSWGDHPDQDLWNTVAVLEALPRITPASYAKLVDDAQKAGGHHMNMDPAASAPPSDPGQ